MTRNDNIFKRFLLSTGALIAIAIALFVIIFMLRMVVKDSIAGVTLLYTLPIGILAIRFGAKVGLAVATFSLGLFSVWDLVLETEHVSVLAYGSRGIAFFVIGGGLGYLAADARHSEDRADRQFDLSLDLQCIARTADGIFARVNPAFEQATGYTRQELTSTPFIEFVHPDDRDRTKEETTRLGQSDAETVSFENRYRTKDASWIWLEWNARSVSSEGLIYANARDVTARRQVEQARKRTEQQALEATQLKSQFLANMSHEIRTPLNGIIGIAELLSDTPLTDEQSEYLDAIRMSGSTLLFIINDVLDFSRIEAGRLELETTDFDLREMIEDVCITVASQAVENDVELLSWIDDALPVVAKGDVNRLRQILTNLVGNAIKFTKQGEVLIRVQPAGKTNGVANAQFDVKDTGIGIDAEAQKHLFDSFSQADASTTRRYGGTGLGLAISKQLVELMDGTIKVESEPGIGSTFSFTVPLEVTSPNERRGERAELTGLHVLIVDDNATNRMILDNQFGSWGMSRDSASSGEQALELLHAAIKDGVPYELALLDLNMPDMDGLELARRIQATPSLRTVRMIILSSSGFSREGAASAGISGFVTKPVRQSRLYDEISRVMGPGSSPGMPSSNRRRAATAVPSHRTPVLVVEDNPINQTVAKGLLEKRGFRVDVVSDGREAVRMSAAQGYAAIFMDCQMPVLDGYKATREIRERENSEAHVPIIAMTANTMKGARDRCLEAGMDDHLGKPITPGKLDPMLERWLNYVGHKTGGREAGADSPSTNVPDVSSVSELKEKFGVPVEVIEEIAKGFIEQAPAAVAESDRALSVGDADQLRGLAHKLRGSCLNMGAEDAAELAAEVEQAAGGNDLYGAGKSLVRLKQSVKRAVSLVQSDLDKAA